MADVSWRPTADSMRNLAWFWTVLGVSAGSIAVARSTGAERSVVLTVLVLGAVGGVVVAAVWNRPRVERALAKAIRPKLANWPPTLAQRAEAARGAKIDAARAAALAVVIGAVAGLVPVVGSGLAAGVAAAGVAGALGTVLVWTSVRRFERANGATVLTASRDKTSSRPELVLGVVSAAARARATGHRVKA